MFLKRPPEPIAIQFTGENVRHQTSVSLIDQILDQARRNSIIKKTILVDLSCRINNAHDDCFEIYIYTYMYVCIYSCGWTNFYTWLELNGSSSCWSFVHCRWYADIFSIDTSTVVARISQKQFLTVSKMNDSYDNNYH